MRLLKRAFKTSFRRFQRWLEREEINNRAAPLPFENSYAWLRENFLRIVRQPLCKRRPAYVWGVLQGVALAKVLGFEQISVIEFGVANGIGLLALEQTAEIVEQLPDVRVRVEVHGFDTGKGLPQPIDYRDCPNLWSKDFYAMDQAALRSRLQRAHLHLGLIADMIPVFLQASTPPVAFIAVDVDFYSSARDALTLFEATPEHILPRIFCYFDDIMGLTFSDYTGERLAIAEFNATHVMRKVSPLYGLKYFVPRAYAGSMWAEMFYLAHFFDHPLYCKHDQLRMKTTGRV